MAELRLVTFNGETVTPQDDSILYQTATVDGLYNNASFTIADATTIHVGGTFAILAGRFIEISEQDVSVALATTQADQKGQIYLKMDLSNADAPIDMIVETAASEAELTPMVTDPNVNINNSVYMMRLILFGVSTSTVYNLEDQTSSTIPIIASILPINANFANRNIAREEKRTSQNAYNVNDLIIYNTTLYKATTAIRVGDVLQEGKNITPTTVASKFGGVSFSIENGKAWVTYVVNGQVIKKALGSLDPSTLTATPTDVLSGKTFGGSGSDEPQTGTMINNGGKTKEATADINSSKLRLRIPERACYSTTSYLTCDPGTATRAQVLKGKTFTSTAGVKTSGTMTNVADSTLVMSKTRLDEPLYANGSQATYREIVTPYNKNTGEQHTTTYLALKIPVGRYFPDNSWVGCAIGNFGSASVSQVLSGKTFTSSNGINISGTMPDRTASASYWYESGKKHPVIIPSETTNPRMNVIYNSSGTATSSKYLEIYLGASALAGYYGGGAVIAVEGDRTGTATAAQVLSGKTFTSTAGVKVSGTMTDYTVSSETARKTFTPSTSAQSYTIPTGYYSGSNVVKCNAVSTQTKTATPTTSSQDITPDSGKFLSKVTVNAISTQTKTATPSFSSQDITPDSGKYLSKVTVSAIDGGYTNGFICKVGNNYNGTPSIDSFDLGASKIVKHVYCSTTLQNDTLTPTVQYSTNNSTWATLGSTNYDGRAITITARYFRVTTTGNSTNKINPTVMLAVAYR